MINAENISFSYPNHEVFKGLDFELRNGELVALLGINGSGKTTLFKCLLGFLPLDEGIIRISGKDLFKLGIKEIAKEVAFVPQDHKPGFSFTVEEVVLMGRTPHLGGVFGLVQKDKEKASQAMLEMGILGLSKKPYTQISGGQRQLVLIARALAQETNFLFLDEPTSSLDFKNQLLIWQSLVKLREKGSGILVCTHDPNHVLWFCDRVVILDKGKILASGSPKKVITLGTLKKLYGEDCHLGKIGEYAVVLPAQSCSI